MNDKDSVEKHFLTHLISLIRDNMDKQPSMSQTSNLFDQGKSLAYHEVADFVIECSQVFDFPLTELGIENFDPDRLM